MPHHEFLVDILWRLHAINFKLVENVVADKVSADPFYSFDKFQVFWTISGNL